MLLEPELIKNIGELLGMNVATDYNQLLTCV